MRRSVDPPINMLVPTIRLGSCGTNPVSKYPLNALATRGIEISMENNDGTPKKINGRF
jgi:hypothetical protein